MLKTKIAAVAIAATAALGTGAISAGASTVNTPVGVPAGTSSVAGWYATADGVNEVYPTHVTARLGSDGFGTLDDLAASNVSSTGTVTINGGEGIGLENAGNGFAVQVGYVKNADGTLDVVAAEGTLTGSRYSFGYAGIVNPAPAAVTVVPVSSTNALVPSANVAVLLSEVPVNSSVDVGLKLESGYSHGAASSVTVTAQTVNSGAPQTSAVFDVPTGTVFNEVQEGIVNDNTDSTALGVPVSSIPLANNGAGNNTTFGRVAHFDVSANEVGGHEFHGAKDTNGAPLATSTAFTGYPVYTYTAGDNEAVYQAPSGWTADNSFVSGGIPLPGSEAPVPSVSPSGNTPTDTPT
jgi:hypothetical protein